MEATKTRQMHFRDFSGSSSTRANSRGVSDFGEVELQPPVLRQLADIDAGAGTDEERKRIGGHYRKLLHNEQRARFEEIFVQVANARLPRQAFLSIVEEARWIWRGEYSELLSPSPPCALKKRRKRP